MGVDDKRASAILRACRSAPHLEEAADMDLPEAMRRRQLVPGIRAMDRRRGTATLQRGSRRPHHGQPGAAERQVGGTRAGGRLPLTGDAVGRWHHPACWQRARSAPSPTDLPLTAPLHDGGTARRPRLTLREVASRRSGADRACGGDRGLSEPLIHVRAREETPVCPDHSVMGRHSASRSTTSRQARCAC